MIDESEHRGLRRLLVSAARAHHEAMGAANDDWATWYAEHLHGDVDEFVGFSPSVESIAGWLRAADAEHRTADPDGRWPPFYARYIIEEQAGR